MYIKSQIRFLFIALTGTFLLGSCGNNIQQKQVQDPDKIKEELVKANKKLVKTEELQIEDYISRYHWKMTTTGTGLHYLIYSKGGGAQAKKGMTAQIRYSVSLINGVEVYNSATEGMKSFKLGKAQVENGLEEGILLMREGDKAKLIIPSHLAFGLTGDDNKIPQRATLIYDVELVRVY